MQPTKAEIAKIHNLQGRGFFIIDGQVDNDIALDYLIIYCVLFQDVHEEWQQFN